VLLLRPTEILLATWLVLGMHAAEASAAVLTSQTPSVRLQGDVEPSRRVPIPPPPATLIREWAGIYRGLSSRLKFESGGTASYQVIACMQSHEETCGRVRELQGRLFIDGFDRPPLHLVPVRWGARRYLVRVEQMEKFCLGVNSGWEQRTEGYSAGYLRVDEAGAPLQGLPSVPEEFRPLLLDCPIEARVVELLGPGRYRSRQAALKVRLDTGTASGMRAGMKMRLLQPGALTLLEVESASEHESIALVPLCGSETQPASIGSRFSSRVW
jgi:hypothetical protein